MYIFKILMLILTFRIILKILSIICENEYVFEVELRGTIWKNMLFSSSKKEYVMAFLLLKKLPYFFFSKASKTRRNHKTDQIRHRLDLT